MLKRILPFLLALTLLMTVSFGLAEEAGSINETTIAEKAQMSTKIEKVTDTPVTLTMWMDISSHDVSNIIGDLQNNMDILKVLEEKTGVHLELVLAPVGEAETSFSLMLASGKYPDIIVGFDYYYSKGGDSAINDGIIYDLKDYVAEYAPNYTAVRMASRYREIGTITDSGTMPYICEPTYMDDPGLTYGGAIIRQDLLDKLGMSMPVTYDDWHTYLTRCKNELGMTRGLGLASTGINKYNAFNAGFGFAMNNTAQEWVMYQVDGTVMYGPLSEGYQEYIAMMAQWYQEGLIDPDFTSTITFDDGVAMMSSNLCSAASDHGGVLGYLNSLGTAVDPSFNFVAAPNPVKTAGDQLHVGYLKGGAGLGKIAAISTACKTPEIAVKFLDQLFSDEGFMLCNYGTEGKTYNLVEGLPVYTDLVANNDKGTITDMLCAYAAPIVWPFECVLGRDDVSSSSDMAKVWDTNDDYAYSYPSNATLNEEEKEVYSDLYPEIKSYVDEMTVKFIMGLEPLENYASFVETLNSLGVQDVINAYQNAYDRYMSR